MTIQIYRYDSPKFDLNAFKILINEYKAYHAQAGIPFDFQDLEEELKSLPGKYQSKHRGQLYLANWNDKPVGSAAIYQLAPNICELKRLYVKPEFHGKKIGKALVEKAREEAKFFGYNTLYLDSVKRMKAAQKLYQRLGFKETSPFNQNPNPDVYDMEFELK